MARPFGLASPVLGLQMGSGASSLPDSAVAKQGLAALPRDFPAGATDPVSIVVDGPAAGIEPLRAELARNRDFAAAALTVETGRGIAVASVPLTVEPSSERASAAVDRLREQYVPRAFGDSRVFVGGSPAEARDAFAVNAGWLPIVIAVVLLLSFVLLTLAFRSIAIPLTAIAVNLLSVGAAYGVLVLVFQEGVGAGLLGFTEVERIESWVPIFRFSVLFGLSMDYQVFLLSRIHERWAATGDTAGRDRPRRLLDGAADHGRRGDHHRRLQRLRDRPAGRVPGDGLRDRRRARARRDARAAAADPGRDEAARRAQLVPAAPAGLAAGPARRRRYSVFVAQRSRSGRSRSCRSGGRG